MAAVNLANMKPEDFKEFMTSFDTVLTDCDGMYCASPEPFTLITENKSLFLNI